MIIFCRFKIIPNKPRQNKKKLIIKWFKIFIDYNQLKLIKILEVYKNQLIVKGSNTFQPNLINWSYLYLGKIALATTNKITKKQIFKLIQKEPGKKFKKFKLKGKGANQPPKNKILVRVLIKSILPYSPKKIKQNP